MTDITLLETSLRESRSDVIALRQRNTELRDYIRDLELRLFNTIGNINHRSNYSNEIDNDDDDNGGFFDAGSGFGDKPKTVVPFTTNNSNNSNNSAVGGGDSKTRELERRCKELEQTLAEYSEKLSMYKYKLKTPEKRKTNNNIINNNNGARANINADVAEVKARLSFNRASDSETTTATTATANSEGLSFDFILNILSTEQRRYMKDFVRLAGQQDLEEKDKTIRQLAEEIKQLTAANRRELKPKEPETSKQLEHTELTSKSIEVSDASLPAVKSQKIDQLQSQLVPRSTESSMTTFLAFFLLGAVFSLLASALFQWNEIVVPIGQFLSSLWKEYQKRKQ